MSSSRGESVFSGDGVSAFIKIGDLAKLGFYAENLIGCYLLKISDRLNFGTSIASFFVLNEKPSASDSIFSNYS